jgi:hypothetical protein
MTGMTFKVTSIDADGNVLEGPQGQVPPGCVGAVVRTPSGVFVAVPITEETKVVDGNLGVYETFQLAVAALLANHRRQWSREERRRVAGGW